MVLHSTNKIMKINCNALTWDIQKDLYLSDFSALLFSLEIFGQLSLQP